MTEDQNIKKNIHYYFVMFLFVLIPVVGILLNKIIPHEVFYWEKLQLHTSMETLGAVIAIVVAALFAKREDIEPSNYFLPIAAGFACMGILDGFHSTLSVGDSFIFTHAMAGFFGSLGFCCIWIPGINEAFKKHNALFLFFILLACLLGMLSLLFPAYVPLMHSKTGYTALAVNIHYAASILFLGGALRLTIDYQKTNKFEYFILLCLSLLFCLSEVSFNYSFFWTTEWWFIHCVRLLAYLVVLRFLFNDYQRLVDRLNVALKDREKAEKKLQEEHNRLISIFDSMEDPIYVADPKTYEVLYVNEAARILWGGLQGQACYKVFQNLDAPCSFCTNKEIFGQKTGEPHVWEFYHDKINKWFRNVDKAIPWSDGRMVRLEISVNIDDVKQAEKAMKETSDMKSKFISMASHELRTPLTTIQESVNIVLDGITGSLNQEQSHILSLTKTNIKRLSRLVNDILDFQKLQSGKMPFYFADNNINVVIKDICESFAGPAGKKGLFVRYNLDESMPLVHCDKDRITQVILNIVNNAIKFTKEGGIVISASLDKNTAHIKVIDTGPGIHKKDMTRLFKTFEQIRTNENLAIKGTGLGLAISKEIISEHKGRIWVESEEGKGSEFHFTIPLK
ncbi:MAG: ATP-binding protein [bacterium]|nr:PAS domain-containing protein [bacterium]MBU1918616.1 PAS domain-containing protein [bacterium]